MTDDTVKGNKSLADSSDSEDNDSDPLGDLDKLDLNDSNNTDLPEFYYIISNSVRAKFYTKLFATGFIELLLDII